MAFTESWTNAAIDGSGLRDKIKVAMFANYSAATIIIPSKLIGL